MFPSVYESLQHLHMHTLIKSFITECVHISHWFFVVAITCTCIYQDMWECKH